MVKKLVHNIGSDAIRLLGWKNVAKMWWGVMVNFPQILHERNLRPLDRFMADGTIYTVNAQFGSFRINPRAVDQLFSETSFCFGGVRELYIRNCYLRYHEIDPKRIRTVVDLGANRGLASLLFTPVASQILTVDFAPESERTIRYNLVELNEFQHVDIVTCILGPTDQRISDTLEMKRISTVLEAFSIQEIDFLKMDIEGSEFDIMSDLPLDNITYISMEVHHQFGSVTELVDRLSNHSFAMTLATEDMEVTSEPNEAAYIFARNLNRLGANHPMA